MRHQRTVGPIGVLLLQLGTPDDPSVPAVRRYLAEFLSDPRIIETNRFRWWFILHGIILRFRPRQSADKYRRIWSAETGMPMLHYTRRQTELLQAALGDTHLVRFGMRYGSPSIPAVVSALLRDGVSELIVLPMYPQYSATSTASALDALFQTLPKERRLPHIRVIASHHDHPAYLHAMTALMEEELAKLTWQPEHFILTYHGIPQSYAKKGDPYATHVQRTTQALVQAMGWRKGSWSCTYQSLFGRDAWLKPYTEDRLKQLAREGKKRVFIATPGFAADCLETIDEVGRELRETFQHAGGAELHRCPCLNDHPLWIEALRQIVTGADAITGGSDAARHSIAHC
jgi:protoporphyrin/coproporphyrin ferrochelatase